MIAESHSGATGSVDLSSAHYFKRIGLVPHILALGENDDLHNFLDEFANSNADS